MENNQNLFANLEERKEPLLSVPPLNLDDLNDDEPLRGDGAQVTFRGDSVNVAERTPQMPIEQEARSYDQAEQEAINGLREYHFTPDTKKWQHKVFLRKYFNTLSKQTDLAKDLEIEKDDLQDIAFGDNQLALEILQREAEQQDMQTQSEAEINESINQWFKNKQTAKKAQERALSDYSQSQIGVSSMWDKAIDADRDERFISQAKKIVPHQDTFLEKFGQLTKQEQMMTVPQANDWILKNQGKAREILHQKFTEKMESYNKFKREFGCPHEDFEMVTVQGQVQYLARVSKNGKLQIEHYRFNQLVKTITLNDDLKKAHSSLVSYQQCGSFIYFFKVKIAEDDQIQETLPTNITAQPQMNRRISTASVGNKQIKKVNLVLYSYDMSLDSVDNEPRVVQEYEAPMKFDTSNGIQMMPASAVFVNQQSSEFSKTKQNWPKGVPGNDCKKFLESLVMAIVYLNPDNQSYKLSLRSMNASKFTASELYFTQKAFPLNKCLQLLVAKKHLNKQLPSSQVLMIFCAAKGYFAFSTETMLCMSTGGGIGTYISKLNDLEAFKPQNKELQSILNKASSNKVGLYESSFYILDEKEDFWQIRNREVFHKIWKLVEKLLSSKVRTHQMPSINAFYDVTQDTMTVILGRQGQSPLEVILINRRANRQLIIDSLRDQSNNYGFVPPHLRVMQLKHYSSQQSLINFLEERDCLIQASYQYTNFIRDNQVVYLQYKVEGDPIIKELVDPNFQVNYFNGDILHQDKSHKKGTQYVGHNQSLGNRQIEWRGDQFMSSTDCYQPCRVIMEKIIFREDDRVERPMVIVKESQFGKIESLWFTTYNFTSNQVNNQVQISLDEEDLQNIQEVYLSASSDFIDELSPRLAMTSSQKFQVCLKMITNQIKIIEFQVYWVPNKSKDKYITSVQLKGQKMITQQQQNFGEVLFFGPLFKNNYEIVGSQIVLRDDLKLSYLNMENTKPYEFQFQNEFGDIAYAQEGQIMIIEVAFSQKLLQEKNLSIKDKLEVAEQIIQAALIIKPFKVHDYLLTEDWSTQFFTNLELLNGYSFADFSLNDSSMVKEKIMSRMSENRDGLISKEMQEFDPIFEKTIHLTSLLERSRQYFEVSKMALIEPMLQEVDNLNLNSTKYLILLENLDIIILSKSQSFQEKLLQSECVIDLSPLQLKRKLNSFSSGHKVQGFTSYDLALSLCRQRLDNQDVLKLALIDQQWKVGKLYYWSVAILYAFGYFCPLYVTIYDQGQIARVSSIIALATSLILTSLSLTSFKQGVNKVAKAFDLSFFIGYTLFYCFRDQETPCVKALTVLLIFHSIVKLGEISQIFETSRRANSIIMGCIVDLIKIAGVVAVILGAFGAINQVQSSEDIGLGESIAQVYDSSFSFDLLNDGKVDIFSMLVKLLQQLIVPIILINLVVSTLAQSYDKALGNDFEQLNQFKASYNLEFFALSKSLFKNLIPLDCLEFQVSQEFGQSLEENKTNWHGFVKTIKNFIHQERVSSEISIQQISHKIESIEKALTQALDQKIPSLKKEATLKANTVAQDLTKVKSMVQSLLDHQNKEEETKLQKQQSIGGFFGAFGGPRSSVISTKEEQKTPTKSERIESAQSPQRKTPLTTDKSTRAEQITSRYKERNTFASPRRELKR